MSNAFDLNPESEKNYIYIYIRIYLHTRTSLYKSFTGKCVRIFKQINFGVWNREIDIK